MADAMEPRGIGERDPANAISLMLTRRCNMTCAHCSVESGPKIREEPSNAELIDFVHSAADAGITFIQITGGEPMLREKLVLELLKAAKKRGMGSNLSTNGFWGRSRAKAWSKVATLKRAGLGRITVSYDRYHAEFQGAEPALNIASAAEWFDVPLNINVTRVADDPELEGLVAAFEKRRHLKMRFYDVQLVGRARELPLAEIRGETSGFCNACSSPSVTDDGRMTACNGPAYFLESESPLVIGSLRDTPLHSLLEAHSADTILETIRRAGPERLLRELKDAGVADELGIRKHHSGLCDLCIDINSNPAAVAVLRERFQGSRYEAELTARRLVIKAGQSHGSLKLAYVNGMGAARFWMNAGAGRTTEWAREAEQIIGRADYDWRQGAEYIAQCGVARGLVPVLDHPELKRWAPTFFIQRAREAGVKEGLLELAQREVLRRLSSVLSNIDEQGVLLKGGALMALDAFGDLPPGKTSRRAAGDIDLLVKPEAAESIRNHLLRAGFAGNKTEARTGPHHLAPVSLNGVFVELHTSIMPELWRLPEGEMLKRSRPVAHLPSISTLDPEGMMLHALVHSTAHLYSYGLRAAWDCAWLLERFPAVDINRLLEWVGSLAMPRSFWVPARVLGKETVSFPRGLMQHAPSDERQRRLERVAEVRLFSALEGAFDLNPISKNGFFLMLYDSVLGRARHLTSLLGHDEREARRSAAERARKADPDGNHSAISIQIRQGMNHWRQYQRAASR
ncbi:MAG: nucleotidyltransferase family protein [Gemmatimonadales bacterium]